MGTTEVEGFLSSLAAQRCMTASTQNQARRVLLFQYHNVLGIDLPWMEGIAREKRAERLPVVITGTEVKAGADKPAPCHTRSHSFATHLL